MTLIPRPAALIPFLLAGLICGCQNSPSSPGNTGLKPINNAEEARAQAIAVIGLQDIKSVNEITLTQSNIPFLADKVIGQVVWQVEFAPGSLNLKSAPAGVVDNYPRNFTALFRKDTGQFISLKSPFNGVDPDMRPESSSASATEQIKSTGEQYLGFPEANPKLTFIDALDKVYACGPADPYLAKEISAIYVMYTGQGSPAQPVWVITMRGIPPFQSFGDRLGIVPVWERNYLQAVVDASTGQVLSEGNVPGPGGK